MKRITKLNKHEEFARNIASDALEKALNQTDVPYDQFMDAPFIDKERVLDIYLSMADDITLLELVHIASALGMVLEIGFISPE